MTDWLTIRVVLTDQGDEPLPVPPGRVLLVHGEHTFAELAEAIDTAFGRWDLTPVHQFHVEGRVLVPLGAAPYNPEAEDSDEITVGQVGLRAGAQFRYTFDLGEGWGHDCLVEDLGVDPFELAGEEPDIPVPVFGWGTIPDQYGRSSDDEDAEEDADLVGAFEEELRNDLVDDLDELDELDELDDDLDDLDDWYAAERASWQIVTEAVAQVSRPRPAADLASAVAALRAAAEDAKDDDPATIVLAAAGFRPGELPEDDEVLWLRAAAGVVAPRTQVDLDPDTLGAWASLEPADWAGAVVELVRSGPGTQAEPDALLEMIQRCPEVDSEDLEPEDEAALLDGLELACDLWVALGALDEERRLTPLGRWGLPEALRLAWTVEDA